MQDGFGTGYSSLGRLRTFPIDRLKVSIEAMLRVQAGVPWDGAQRWVALPWVPHGPSGPLRR